MDAPEGVWSDTLRNWIRPKWSQGVLDGGTPYEPGSQLQDLGWIAALFAPEVYDLVDDDPSKETGLVGDSGNPKAVERDRNLLENLLTTTDPYLKSKFARNSDKRLDADKVNGMSWWKAIQLMARGRRSPVQDAEVRNCYGGEGHTDPGKIDHDPCLHSYTFVPAYAGEATVQNMWTRVKHFLKKRSGKLAEMLEEVKKMEPPEDVWEKPEFSPAFFPGVVSNFVFHNKFKGNGTIEPISYQALAVLVEQYVYELACPGSGLKLIVSPPAPKGVWVMKLGLSRTGKVQSFRFDDAKQTFKEQCELLLDMLRNGQHDILGPLSLAEYPSAKRYNPDWLIEEVHEYLFKVARLLRDSVPLGLVSKTVSDWLWSTSQALMPPFPNHKAGLSQLTVVAQTRSSNLAREYAGHPDPPRFSAAPESFAVMCATLARIASDHTWGRLVNVPMTSYPMPRNQAQVRAIWHHVETIRSALEAQEKTPGMTPKREGAAAEFAPFASQKATPHTLDLVRTWVKLMANINTAADYLQDLEPRELLRETGVL